KSLQFHSLCRNRSYSVNQCAWCVPQKSIGGAVEGTLGNAPYQSGDLLRSAFGIALGFSF
ncbi:MAG: hypothetical protein ACKPGT_32910, partial [Microcystis sp.]